MLIQYKNAAPGSMSGYVTLADATVGDVLKEWRPNAALNSVQRENLAAAVGQNNNSYRQPLGNISTKLTLDLTITKGTETQAAAFARTTCVALLGSKNHFSALFGTEQQYYPNGICTRCEPNFLGCTVEFTIELETDLVTSVAP